MKKSKFKNETNGVFPNENYFERARLNALLKNAIDYPLIIVCAGSGYGKTQAVTSFLQQFEAQTVWLQITERDNIPTRFWESYSNQVSLLGPKFGARLKEIGFPKTDAALAKCVTARRAVAELPGKHIRVFDHCHLLRDPEVLRFLEWAVNTPLSNLTVILITRSMPEINLVGMMMRGLVFTIQEDMLRFTEDEIAKYFNQLKLPATRDDIRNISEDTQGWAFAINLIGRSLSKERKYERYALEAMKKIFSGLSRWKFQELFPGRCCVFCCVFR